MKATIQRDLRSHASDEKRKVFMRFFRTGKGEYGEGDKFIGVTVPEARTIAKKYSDQISLKDTLSLLRSDIHEDRLCALIILTIKYEKSTEVEKEKISKEYLANTRFINNWDLVDLSCYKILGEYLLDRNDYTLLLKLAKSNDVWERRIAIVSTFAFLKQGKSPATWKVAGILMEDEHDLIHKATGWMLREMGKRVGESVLTDFLDKHVHAMPRTSLRYGIEKLPEKTRRYYLNFKKSK